MLNDSRKAKRKPLHHRGWIALRSSKDLQPCTVSDVSETGARIATDSTVGIPDEFMLLLSSNAKARRLCRVIWRNAQQFGVEFHRPYD